MPSSTSLKKIGRPATGQTPAVPVRLDAELLAIVDAVAKREGLTRSDAIRALIRRGNTTDQDSAGPAASSSSTDTPNA